MKESWLQISPQDKEAIEEFCADIGKLHSFTFPVGKTAGYDEPYRKG